MKKNLFFYLVILLALTLSACGSDSDNNSSSSGSISNLTEGFYILSTDGEVQDAAVITISESAIVANYCQGDDEIFTITGSSTAVATLSDEDGGGTATVNTFSSSSFGGTYTWSEDGETDSGTFQFTKSSQNRDDVCGEFMGEVFWVDFSDWGWTPAYSLEAFYEDPSHSLSGVHISGTGIPETALAYDSDDGEWWLYGGEIESSTMPSLPQTYTLTLEYSDGSEKSFSYTVSSTEKAE